MIKKTNKLTCNICGKTIRSNMKRIACDCCGKFVCKECYPKMKVIDKDFVDLIICPKCMNPQVEEAIDELEFKFTEMEQAQANFYKASEKLNEVLGINENRTRNKTNDSGL